MWGGYDRFSPGRMAFVAPDWEPTTLYAPLFVPLSQFQCALMSPPICTEQP